MCGWAVYSTLVSLSLSLSCRQQRQQLRKSTEGGITFVVSLAERVRMYAALHFRLIGCAFLGYSMLNNGGHGKELHRIHEKPRGKHRRTFNGH